MAEVLLIDDDPICNFITEKFLRDKLGYRKAMLSFENPEDASDHLLKLKAEGKLELLPKILFLDINMPQITGFEFMDRMCDMGLSDFNIGVYILSSSVDFRDQEKAKNYHCVKGFISKPLSVEKLQSVGFDVSKL